VVQTALKLVLEPIFEKEFLPVSFGFHPGRSCKDALRVVDQALKDGYTRVLELTKRYIDQEVMGGMKRWTPVAGMPQGLVISPLMPNLYLHGLDKLLSEAGYQYARFADDFLALCRSRHEAEAGFPRSKSG